jgi:hypothetical protein
MSNGLDISHWTEWNTGPIEAAEIESMRAHNVERVVVSIAYHDIARRQIEAIHAAMPDVEIQTYRYYYWDRWGTALTEDEAFIAAMRRDGYDLQFHWIDIEDNSVARQVAENVRDLRAMIDFWAGKCPTGIYTAKWVWDSTMPGVTEFSYMPLWYADWDWQEKLELDAPFGGWTVGAMRQTSGDFVMDDVILCDTNYYEKAVVVPPPVEPPVNHKKRALALLEEAMLEVEAIDVK